MSGTLRIVAQNAVQGDSIRLTADHLIQSLSVLMGGAPVPTAAESMQEGAELAALIRSQAGDIAHDLGGQLGGVQWMLMEAQRISEERGLLQDDLAALFAEMRDCLDLSAGTLTEFRLDLGAKKREPLGLVSLLTVTKIRSQLGRDCALTIDHQQRPWLVVGHRISLARVMTNFIKNAREAMAGREEKRFSVTTRNVSLSSEDIRVLGRHAGCLPLPADYVRISFQDNGSGISTTNLEKLFQEKFTTKSDPHGPKRGHGLAVSCRIIQSHGGFIEVLSREGAGTRFNIYLPRARSIASMAKVSEVSTVGAGHTILVVDDDPTMIKVIRAILLKSGYSGVLTAANAREARCLFESHSLSIGTAIIDHQMPDEDGMSLAQALMAKSPQLRVLFSSADPTLRDLHEKKFERRKVTFFPKPFAFEELGPAVQELIDRK